MRKFLTKFLLIIVIAGGVAGFIYYKGHAQAQETYKTEAEKDPYVRFTMEAYDSISTNYWAKPEQYDQFGMPTLPNLFQLAAKQVSGTDTPLASTARDGVAEMLGKSFKAATSTDQERLWALQSVSLVINTLLPTGRNQVLSTQQETQLRQEVSNINPSNDLYGNLGLKQGASADEVNQAYQQKSAELAKENTPAAKEELQKVAYAHQVLADQNSKTLYDQNKVEPTIFAHVYDKTLYLYVKQIAPTTLQKFGNAINDASTTALDSLILDLRGNVGGALDFVPAFLGLFVGSNQYAFDFYHQGDYTPIRTTLGQFPELARFKGNIAVLTDNMTQSTAEVTSAAMKRYNLARLVGGTTRGWGSVENTYPLKTNIDSKATYTLLLVNNLTLRDDNLPIEGSGVVPDVAISDKNWQSQLRTLFESSSIVQALTAHAAAAPVK